MSQSSAGKFPLMGRGGEVPEFMASFIEYSLDAIVALNLDGQVIYLNPAAERMFGWKAPEALGKKPEDLYWYGDSEQGNARKQLQFPKEAGPPVQGEQLVHRKEGPPIWVEYHLHPFLTQGHKLSGYVNVYHDVTEHKHTEEALRENERRFLSMADAAPVMIWASGIDKRCTWFNQPWLDFVGRTLEQELGDGWTENVHPDDLERCWETYSTAFDERQPFTMEYRLKRWDGEYRWMLDNGVPTYGPGDEFTGYIGSCIDITEHKHLEKALSRSEELFGKAFHASPNALVISHVEDGLIDTVNDTFVEFFGYSREEALGKTSIELDMFVNPADRQEAVHKLQTDGFVRDFELDVRLKSGETRSVNLSVEVISIRDKTMMLTTLQDITEQKRTEAQLELSNQRMNVVLDSIQDDFYVLNRDWVFVYASRQFTSRIGKEPKDFIGNNIWEMFPKHLGTVLEENFRAAMDKREVRRFDVVGKYTDAWYRMTVYPSAEGVTVLGRDVTAQKRAEEQLRYHAALLSSVNDAIIASDAQYHITAWNSAAESMYGWKSEEVIGQDGLKLIQTKWPEQNGDEIRRVISELGHWRGEASQVRKDGSRFPVELSALVLRDENGQVTGYVSVNRDITGRKRMEDEIASMARFPLENPNPVMRIQPDGVISFANASSGNLLRCWARAVGERLPEPEFQLALKSLNSRTVIEQEVDCEDRIYSLIYTPVPEFGYINIYGRDISERKQAEEALHKSLQELRAHADNSPLGIVTFDREYRIIEWSAGAERIFGWHAEEVLNKKIPEFRWVHEDDAQRVARLSADMFAGRTPSNAHTNRNYRKDGSVVECEWYNSTLRDANGNLISVRSQVLDVTERKQMQEQLRESEKNFRTLADTVPSIVWTAAPDGKLIYANEYWYRYTGTRPHGTSIGWEQFTHPDDRERSRKGWSRAVETEADEYFIEARVRRYDGIYRWFQTRAIPVRDEQGNITAWYGVSSDIHDRIEALHALRDSQQQLRFLNESLEQKVAEQTAEIRYLASELTRVEQRERNRIAHILHDDLQQRLYAAKLRLAVLSEGKNVDQVIEKELVEADKQLSEVLSITRNLTIELSPPVLRDEGLTQALVWLAAQIHERQGFRIEIQSDASFAMADEAVQVLLFNAVRELLFNTIKHAGIDRALVSLKRSDNNLVVEVRDSGKGFDVAVLESGDKNRSADSAGRTSFGLSTLRHQLSLVGGRMEIQSEPGAGTCVTITIPYS